MKHSTIKPLLFWTLIIGILVTAYYLYSPRAKLINNNFLWHSQTTTEQSLPQQNKVLAKAEIKHLEQEKIIKQRLIEDFENAFLKQYTPPVGCESWENESHRVKCMNHQIKAKQAFRQDYIKSRGLPKDTFSQPQLSLVD